MYFHYQIEGLKGNFTKTTGTESKTLKYWEAKMDFHYLIEQQKFILF